MAEGLLLLVLLADGLQVGLVVQEGLGRALESGHVLALH